MSLHLIVLIKRTVALWGRVHVRVMPPFCSQCTKLLYIHQSTVYRTVVTPNKIWLHDLIILTGLGEAAYKIVFVFDSKENL